MAGSLFFHFCEEGWTCIGTFLDFLSVDPPPKGYRVVPEGVMTSDGCVLVYDRCTIVLRYEKLLSPSDAGSPHEQDRGLSDFGIGSPPDRPGLAARTAEPRRFERGSPPSPDPEEVLATDPPGDGRTVDEDIEEIVYASFLVFSPRFQHERYQLELNVPCDVDSALQELAHVRNQGNELYFDRLVPAFPQPDVAFVSVLAIPTWAGEHSCGIS